VKKQETKYNTAAHGKHVRQFKNNWDRQKVKCSPQFGKADWEIRSDSQKDGRQRGKSRHHVKHVSAPDLLVVKNPVWSQEEQPCLRTGTRICLWMFEKLWIFKFCLKSKLKFKFWLVRLGVTAAGADRSSTNDGSASCPCAG
jgi:hypothetical protein